MDGMKKYFMGIVGFGNIAGHHYEWLKDIPEIHVKGVCDISVKQQEKAANMGLKVYESLEAMLADPDIGIVLCATPNDSHKEIVMKALRGGRHVICEKPAAMTPGDFEEMMAAQETSRLFVHQNRRWDDDYLTVKEIVRMGTLGEIYRIESRIHGSRGIPSPWRRMPEHGGGIVYDWGVHLIDQMIDLFPGKVQSVYASATHLSCDRVDDGFRAEFHFDDGRSCFLESVTCNFMTLPRWYILGKEGTAVIQDWDLNGEMVCLRETSGEAVISGLASAGPTLTMAPRLDGSVQKQPLPVVKSSGYPFYENVLKVLAGQEKPAVENTEVLQVLRLMDCVFRSIETNRVITL